MTLSIDGLVSGIDTATLVEGLVSIQQSQVSRLTSQKDEIVAQQTAFKGIEAQLLSLRGKLSALGRSQNNIFDAKLATVSDESLVQVSASGSAINGSYNITVNSLATAHQVASQTFSEPESQITQGTLTIQVGNGSSVDVTIDSSNNTVQGLVDAINFNSDDVFASLITDSSGTRILLTGQDSGAANTITITNNLGASSGEAIQPDFSGDPVQQAADASITVGSGTGALTITNSTNQFDNVFEGVAINVIGADPGKEISISINNDNQAIEEAVQGFVESFNSLMSYIDTQTDYNVDNESGGPLIGNRSTLSIQNDLRNRLVFSIPGLDSTMNQLSAVGIQFNDSGQLFLNSAELQQAINGDVEGVTSQDVKRLFSLDGQTETTGIEFLLGSSRTQASATPYEVDITQAAERAEVESKSVAASVVIDSSNDTFSLAIDGKSTGQLTLTHGTYTREEIAEHLEQQINNSSELSGQSVEVYAVNDQLKIRSNTYGSQSEINSLTGTALSVLALDDAPSDTGQDVVGRFIVDGQIEEATGSGRLLTGSPDNANTADIQLRVTLNASQVVNGSETNLTVTRGFASQLDQLISDFLDPADGKIKTTDDSFQEQIESVEASIKSTEELMQSKTESLLAEFAAMERALSQLQNQASFLASQFGAASALPTS